MSRPGRARPAPRLHAAAPGRDRAAGGVHSARRSMTGRPPWRKSRPSIPTSAPREVISTLPVSVNSPTTAASTSRRFASARNSSMLSRGTARLIRSWDSLTRISHASRPGYFSGHASRSMDTPPLRPAISPRDDDSPPAPLSVMPRYSPAVTRLQEHVQHLLLRDGVADLDGRGGRRFAQRLRGEGGAVDPVLADSPAGHHGKVAGEHRLLARVAPADSRREHAARPAEDQRLAEVALVEQERPGRNGDAGLVAAVHDAAVHAFQDPARVQEAGGDLGGGRVGQSEAEDVRVEDGPRAQARCP